MAENNGPEALAGALGADTNRQADSAVSILSCGRAQALRAYQNDVIARLEQAIEAGRRRPLLVAPTGSGKTVIAAAMIAKAAAQGRRVLVVAHRREIIAQTHRKLYDAGIDAGIIQAGFPARPSEPVQVASIQTLHARAIRTDTMPLPPADIVVIDEAHHARAATYQAAVDAYPGAVVIGLTATPCRRDGLGLGNIFDALVECPQTGTLIDLGFLVPSRVYAPSTPDLSGVRTERGDYVEAQLAARIDTDQLVGDIVQHWHRLAERRRTIVFATGVAHSVHIRDELRRSGVMAEHIDGSTPTEERDRVLVGLKSGAVEVVANCAVLTEGFDCPDIGCLVLARPTKSLGLYRQMIGRGLRPAAGKADCIILDHSGAVFRHGLPDDDISWTLDQDRRAENRTHAARGTADAPALKACPECGAVRWQGRPCPVCGWTPRAKAAAVDVVDGDLGIVQRDRRVLPTYASEAERRQFYQQLLWIARQRGYQPGFAFHKYVEKFRGKPAWSWRGLPPLEPEPHVAAWVRSRQIAYARAQDKAAR